MTKQLSIPAVTIQRRHDEGVTRTVQTVSCSCCEDEIDVPVTKRPRPAFTLAKIVGNKGWYFDARRGRHLCTECQ